VGRGMGGGESERDEKAHRPHLEGGIFFVNSFIRSRVEFGERQKEKNNGGGEGEYMGTLETSKRLSEGHEDTPSPKKQEWRFRPYLLRSAQKEGKSPHEEIWRTRRTCK